MALNKSTLLIRDYENIRSILRDVYIYGCFSKDDYVEKQGISGRKYDKEQQRISAYLPKKFIRKRRIDKIGELTIDREMTDEERSLARKMANYSDECWATSSYGDKTSEVVIQFMFDEEKEQYILRRITTEGHGGSIEKKSDGLYEFRIFVRDPDEMIPWVRRLESGSALTHGEIADMIEQYCPGETDFEVTESLFSAKEGEEMIYTKDEDGLIPVMEGTFPVRNSRIENETAKSLVDSLYVNHFLSPEIIEKLKAATKTITMGWNPNNITIKNMFAGGASSATGSYNSDLSLIAKPTLDQDPYQQHLGTAEPRDKASDKGNWSIP